jgi:hypothetical protein
VISSIFPTGVGIKYNLPMTGYTYWFPIYIAYKGNDSLGKWNIIEIPV